MDKRTSGGNVWCKIVLTHVAQRLVSVVLITLLLVVLTSRELHAQPEIVGEPHTTFPVRIDEIRITGLSRTTEHVIRREIGFSEGSVVTKAAFDLALIRLWNMTIFAHVHGHVLEVTSSTLDEQPSEPRHIAVFELEDRWTLNPLASFGFGGGAFFVRVGATDANIAGRFLEAYAFYENFDGYHGGQLILRDPRLFDRRLELAFQVDRLIRPRPGFADQRTQGAVEFAQLMNEDRLRVGIRVSGFTDRFIEPLDTPPMIPPPTNTLLFEPRFRIGRIDTVRLRQKGVTLDMRPGLAFTSADEASARAAAAPSEFVSLMGETLLFLMPGERWNIAVRVRAGTISQVPGAHLELFAGGLDLVRGFPDNFVRSRALTLATIEARYVLFDSTWVAVLPTVFVDAIAARAPHGVSGTASSVGGGVRIIVPKFVASGIRADLAIPIHSTFRPVTVADDGRFGPVTPIPDLGSLQPSFGVYQFF